MTLKRNAWGRYVDDTRLAKAISRLKLKTKKRSSSPKPQHNKEPYQRTIYLNSHGREMMGPLQWSQYPDEY